MTGLKESQLFGSFAEKEYRDAFVEEHISSGLARQIRAIREKNDWTQEELGERTDKAQETISQWENPDYGSFTLKSLKALASAFDVALMVHFVSFRDLIDRVSNLTPETIAPPSYERQMSFDIANMPEGETRLVTPRRPRLLLRMDTSSTEIRPLRERIVWPGAASAGASMPLPALEESNIDEKEREFASAA